MSNISKAGIETTDQGQSYIPSSRRADGSTRKEIRVRPGYRPPEDIETYKNRGAESWKNRDRSGVPGVDHTSVEVQGIEIKSKNAKRREAAKRKAVEDTARESTLVSGVQAICVKDSGDSGGLPGTDQSSRALERTAEIANGIDIGEADHQKRIRNQLKKLKAVWDLKAKKKAGEKLSHDQLMKIGKEDELVRDLKKMNYDGPELRDRIDG